MELIPTAPCAVRGTGGKRIRDALAADARSALARVHVLYAQIGWRFVVEGEQRSRGIVHPRATNGKPDTDGF